MTMRIVASGPIEKQTLSADDHGINYNESAAFGLGTQHRHAFGEIDVILRTTANPALPVLSIQVGKKVYSIRYKAGDEQHRAVVDFIVRKAAQTKEP
jgi:hypothetical protein